MNILWCGGEDIDFQNGVSMSGLGDTSGGRYRSTYSRGTLVNGNASLGSRSNVFPGGAVTSCWLRAVYGLSSGGVTAQKAVGFGLSGTEKGFGLGTDTSAGTKLALYKYDGTTRTQLASESGTSLVNGGNIVIDMQVISFGATATVKVYVGANLLINFSGDLTVTGMTTNFDCVTLMGGNSSAARMSEIIVADADTRSIQGLLTLALTGAGDTNDWTNPTYTNINATTFTDATPTNSNTTGQNNEYNVTDLPSGTFSI